MKHKRKLNIIKVVKLFFAMLGALFLATIVILILIAIGLAVVREGKKFFNDFTSESAPPAKPECYGLAGCLNENEPNIPDPAEDPRADYDQYQYR